MNYLLFLYLNLIRGPRMLEERRVKEEAERVAKIDADRAAGKTDELVCKKCDGEIDSITAARAQMATTKREPMCAKCIFEARAKATAAAEQEMRMTPFMYFQLFVMLAGILTFVHRNVMPLF